MARLGKVLFVINVGKPGSRELAAELSARAEAAGTAARTVSHFPLERGALDGCGLCVVIGGDGTLLGVVEAAAGSGVPVLGVNLGRLGFMASFSPADIRAQFDAVLDGRFSSRRLSVLACTAPDGRTVHALNDIVIKARQLRLIRLEVHCEAEHMNTYHADGLIFATPTGSTAYNLSAGGPIIHPEAPVLVATPINPHTLSNRAIVLNDSHLLEVTLHGDPRGVQVAADGREVFSPVADFPLRVRIQPDRPFLLVLPDGYSHYYVLRTKLKWTGDAVFPW